MPRSLPPLDNPFWQYSLRLYPQTSVASQCLQLQDRCGGNVNLLLLGGWAATQGWALSEAEWLFLQAAIADVEHQAIQPLRHLRRWCDQTEELTADWRRDFKRQLLAIELSVEQLEQAILYQTIQQCALPISNQDERDRVTDNFHAYARLLEKTDQPTLMTALETLAIALTPSAHIGIAEPGNEKGASDVFSQK